MYLKSSFTLILFLVLSCQPVEILRPIEIDTSNLDTISIYSKNIEINKKYNSVFSQNNIEEQIQKSPIDVIVEWHNKNILKIGNENKLVINILDASITRNEIENVDAKKYEETSRSTTSQKYISLNEVEIIINELLLTTMKDYINETKNQLSIYMGDYLSI